MLAAEFGRLAAEKGVLGLEAERFRKVSRALLRTPEIAAEGFNLITDDPAVRAKGGHEVGVIDVSFIILAALLGGAINEDLGQRTWQAYAAPGQNFRSDIDTSTRAGRKRYMAELQCPVTGANRAGDAIRAIMTKPDILAQVRRVTLWRDLLALTILWNGKPRVSHFAPEKLPDTPPLFQVEASISGEALAWFAEVIRPITIRTN